LRGKVRQISSRVRNEQAGGNACSLLKWIFDYKNPPPDCWSKTADDSRQLHRAMKVICGGGDRGGRTSWLRHKFKQYVLGIWAWANISRLRLRHYHRSASTIILRSSTYPVNIIIAAADHPRCWAACLLPSLHQSLI
jgi:hypothetical protein